MTSAGLECSRNDFPPRRYWGPLPQLAWTTLDAGARAGAPVALSEHFHYPHMRRASPRYLCDQGAARVGRHKLIVRRGQGDYYDVEADPCEEHAEPLGIDDFLARCREADVGPVALGRVESHLKMWSSR